MPFNTSQINGLIDVAPVAPVFFVREDYKQILNQLYAGLQHTELWKKVCGSCFCTAGFISLAFTDLGHRVRVLPCYAVALKERGVFTLGYKDSNVASGQVDGHAVCLIDETILVDFGLGNIRRHAYFTDFPNAMAYSVNSNNIFPHETTLDEDKRIIWANGWANPRTDEVMAENRPAYELLYRQYKSLPSTKMHNSVFIPRQAMELTRQIRSKEDIALMKQADRQYDREDYESRKATSKKLNFRR